MSNSGMGKDTTLGTLLRALVICLACSIVVTLVVVSLKEKIAANRLADKQKSALEAAKLEFDKPEQVNTVFANKMQTKIIDLEDNAFADKSDLDALAIPLEDYDPLAFVEDPQFGYKIDSEFDVARIIDRARYMPVYMITGGSNKGGIVLPVYGKGLWGMMYGYLALAKDGNTIISLKFYDQKETPGLGGRIADDQTWLASWEGKLVYGNDGQPKIELVKARSPASAGNAPYEIDSLSGASMTSKYVTNMLAYWMGDDGYGPFMKKFQAGEFDLTTEPVEPAAVSHHDQNITSGEES